MRLFNRRPFRGRDSFQVPKYFRSGKDIHIDYVERPAEEITSDIVAGVLFIVGNHRIGEIVNVNVFACLPVDKRQAVRQQAISRFAQEGLSLRNPDSDGAATPTSMSFSFFAT